MSTNTLSTLALPLARKVMHHCEAEAIRLSDLSDRLEDQGRENLSLLAEVRENRYWALWSEIRKVLVRESGVLVTEQWNLLADDMHASLIDMGESLDPAARDQVWASITEIRAWHHAACEEAGIL